MHNQEKYIFKYFKIGFFICIILLGGFWYFFTHFYSIYGNKIKKILIGEEIFLMEIVDDQSKMAKGLGGRKFLCPNCGMIFIFAKEGRHAFWMKDMLIPLDIIWVENGRIVYIKKNISPKDNSIFSPDVNVDVVLELPAGTSDLKNLDIGEVVELR